MKSLGIASIVLAAVAAATSGCNVEQTVSGYPTDKLVEPAKDTNSAFDFLSGDAWNVDPNECYPATRPAGQYQQPGLYR